MQDSNKTISGVWVGDALPDVGRLCVHSFIAHGHNFVLYAYDEIKNFPKLEGAELRDANEILPRENIFSAKGTYAEFADWFRWELMRQKGGWYADMDMVCLRPWDFSEDVVLGNRGSKYINIAVLKFPAGHKMAAAMTDACANPNKIQPWDDKGRIRKKIKRKLKFWQNPHITQKWGESGGPDGTTLAVKYFNIGDKIKPPDVFYPTETPECFISSGGFYTDLGNAIMRHSYAVHISQNAWKIFGWDKDGTYPPDSLYERLKREYLPDYAKMEKE